MPPPPQKLTTCLWFDKNAEEAVNFFTSIFKDVKINSTTRYDENGPGELGSVRTISFDMLGQQFLALNGGPYFKFNEAISLIVHCADQAEVDEKWAKLLEGGGSEIQCGWLKDKFGLAWQIVPNGFMEMLAEPDAEKHKRLIAAMHKMVKLDLAVLQAAFNGDA